ncbi:MAG: hypothetical protein AAGD06_30445, partial [Acidobacteriota bacterium]
AGLTYQQIGDQMGITRQAANQLIRRVMNETLSKTAESAQVAVCLELERLDEWQVQVVRELRKGNVLPAVDRLLKIAERRAKLLGLDAPKKHKAEVSGPDGGPVPVVCASDLEGMTNAELLGLLE